MAIPGQTLRHPGTGEQLTFRRTSVDTEGGLLEVEFLVEPGGAPAAPHVHPKQRETFTVHAGALRVRNGGSEQVLGPGETAVVEAGVAHTWSAESGEPVQMTVTLEPALTSERFFEQYFTLAEAGKTNAKGMPSLLRIVLLLTDNPETIYLAKPPIPVQKALFRLLAPIARARHGREHNEIAPALA